MQYLIAYSPIKNLVRVAMNVEIYEMTQSCRSVSSSPHRINFLDSNANVDGSSPESSYVARIDISLPGNLASGRSRGRLLSNLDASRTRSGDG